MTEISARRSARCASLAASTVVIAALAGSAHAANPLQAYNADPGSTSVSGLSSGGFMAAQLGVAYSNTFKAGFGVFAGGPFDCARNQNYTACMYNATPAISTPVANMKSWSGNQIDTTNNLAGRRIYLWVGSSDTTVGPNVENQLQKELGNFDTASNVSSVVSSGAVHTFPTDFTASGDNSCNSSVSPYISNCGYDGAGAALKWMYGSLSARNDGALGGTVVAFDQTAFVSAGNGMDTTGYLYVPAACAAGGTTVCKLHVALHGCLQSYSNIQMQFVNNTGYNKWADTNNIIVAYPQAVPDNTSHATWNSGSLANPNGCWDWIGWYGSNADQKGGVQMAAIVAMVNKITSGYRSGGGGSTAPAAPTGLAVTGTTSSTVSLSWNSAPGATSYNIYRGGSKVGSGITSTTYTDSGLSASTTYSYTATGVNSIGESPQSASVSATTASSYTPTCYTANNYAHVTAGRAHDSGGYALANGSNQNMGLDNVYYTNTLEETAPNYYIINNGVCP
jgi:poly(3-hydroxybutyrate) depolymerase